VVSLFTEAFAGLSVAVAHGHQADHLRRVVLPHPLNNRPDEEIRAALGTRMGEIVDGLTATAGAGVDR
jgi:hypothetical protein